MEQIGFGGGCHWCTEAIFQSLKGVDQVLQGWIAPDTAPEAFSEGVIVHFDPALIPLDTLIEIHLHTHSSTSEHSMRQKYRSAVYCFSDEQAETAKRIIEKLQQQFDRPIITKVLSCHHFKLNKTEYLDYYYSGTQKPFCKTIVEPKLRKLLRKFGGTADPEKLGHLAD